MTAKKTPAAKSAVTRKLSQRLADSGTAPATATTPPHVIVKAFAGTGKTFTDIVGVGYVFGQPIWPVIQREIAVRGGKNPDTFKVTPSPEQKLVWDAFAQSRDAKTITYCAFNKSIVTEFGEKWGWMVKLLKEACGVTLQFATINSLGNSACSKTYGRLNVVDWHTENVLGNLLGMSSWDLKKREPVLLAAVTQLVALCKQSLIGWTEEAGFVVDTVDADALDDLTSFYDVELNGQRLRAYDLVPKVLAASASSPVDAKEIDFNDQNWLPVIHGLPVAKSDLLLVDEAQDLNRAKQEFCRKAGRRVVVVGDVNQAIYGFAGADTDSIPRMTTLLSKDQPALVLALTETRRCGKAIVAEAQTLVPDFKAHESNPAGEVCRDGHCEKYHAEANDGDMVLCRVNAPLVSQALRFIKAGKKAIIRGRDFGGQLISFVEKLNADNIPDLIARVSHWAEKETEKENRKKRPSEAKIISINDRLDCIAAFCDGVESIAEVIERMRLVFAGKQCPCCGKSYNETQDRCSDKHCRGRKRNPETGWDEGAELVTPKGVLFSSVHRAKGLEAKQVFILVPPGASMPHPLAKTQWQYQQELNIKYVAITRAIERLVWVTQGWK